MSAISPYSLVSSRRSHRYVDVDDIRVHWVEIAPARPSPSRPPLVLIHGLNDCHQTWSRVGPHLARDRRILMPDLPGHGLSDRPDVGYELAWYANVMVRWLQVVSSTRCDVVGHSFGGGVAQMMLLAKGADRVRRLALVASGGLGREVSWLLRLAALPTWMDRVSQPLMGPCTRLALRAMPKSRRPADVARLSAINARDGSARTFLRTVRDVIDLHGQRATLFERVADIVRLPALSVFWGDSDPIIPVSHAYALKEWFDGAWVSVFSPCGHYPHQECAAEFCEALVRFLDDPTVRPATVRALANPRMPAQRGGAHLASSERMASPVIGQSNGKRTAPTFETWSEAEAAVWARVRSSG